LLQKLVRHRQSRPITPDLPVDPLGVDGIKAGGSPLALEECGDPPVSIAWPGVH
jgi:hypothetical protein